MAKWVKIGDIGINVDDVDGMTEKEYINAFKRHYKHIGNGKEAKMKADYKELKTHFTKKRIKKEGQE